MKLRALMGAAVLLMASVIPAPAEQVEFTVHTGEIWRVDFGLLADESAIIDIYLDPSASMLATFHRTSDDEYFQTYQTSCSSQCSFIGDNAAGNHPLPGGGWADLGVSYVILSAIVGTFDVWLIDWEICPNGCSENYTTSAALVHPVPLPAPLLLFLSALAGMGLVSRARGYAGT